MLSPRQLSELDVRNAEKRIDRPFIWPGALIVTIIFAAFGAIAGAGAALVFAGIGLIPVGLVYLFRRKPLIRGTRVISNLWVFPTAFVLVIFGAIISPELDELELSAAQNGQEEPSTAAIFPAATSAAPTPEPEPEVTETDASDENAESLPETDESPDAELRDAELREAEIQEAALGVEAADTSKAGPQTALAALSELAIKGRAPKTGYDRDIFKYRAVDLDRNGCDTRNDILNRDLIDITHKPGTSGCVVLTGTLHDPYSNENLAFDREDSARIHIDHVVALSDAWQKGAQSWDDSKLTRFGNDPLNLLAVSGRLNSQKGASDAASWLPPNKSYRCPFVARQVAVKHTFGLWVTQAEHDTIARILSNCPNEKLPTGSDIPDLPASRPTATQTPTATSSSIPAAPTSSASTTALAPSEAPPAAPSTSAAGSANPAGSALPISKSECPASHPIKGNHGKKDWIYHVKGESSSYSRTHPEECFASKSDAEKAGYRAPRG